MAITGSFSPSRIAGRYLKPLRMGDGPCLSEIDLSRIKSYEQLPIVPVDVRGIDGAITRREMTPLRVWCSVKVKEYWADLETGSLYDEAGRCLSNSRRRIEAWYP